MTSHSAVEISLPIISTVSSASNTENHLKDQPLRKRSTKQIEKDAYDGKKNAIRISWRSLSFELIFCHKMITEISQ